MKSARRLALAFASLLTAPLAHAGTINVPADQPTIQGALSVAVAGDEVVLAPGTYDISAGLSFPANDVTLRSLSGDATDTILDGNGDTQPVNTSFRTGMVIRDLTFTDCNGAAIVSGEASVVGCRFVFNDMSIAGGAITLFLGQLSVSDCAFENNTNTEDGQSPGIAAFGGVLNVSDSSFLDNTASLSLVSPISAGAAILTGIGSSGGVGAFESATLTVSGCVFGRNEADLGGAIGMYGGDATIDRCLFFSNTGTWGGAVFFTDITFGEDNFPLDARITNSVFTGNFAPRFQGGPNGLGGAAGASGSARLELVNNTFYANGAELFAGGVFWGSSATVTIANNLFSDSMPGPDFSGTGPSTIFNNLSGSPAAMGLADADGPDHIPGTVDDNPRLLPASPAIDAADSFFLPAGITQDYDGLDRLTDDPGTPDTGSGSVSYLDIGAFEFQPASGPCNSADLAEPFGQLDFSDVVAFLVAFGAMGPDADLALPFGQWDFSDVVAFLTLFGAGCP